MSHHSNLQKNATKHTYDRTFHIHSARYYINHGFCLITKSSNNNLSSEIYLARIAMAERVSHLKFLLNTISKTLKLDLKTQFTVLREDCHLLAK